MTLFLLKVHFGDREAESVLKTQEKCILTVTELNAYTTLFCCCSKLILKNILYCITMKHSKILYHSCKQNEMQHFHPSETSSFFFFNGESALDAFVRLYQMEL